MKKTRKNRPREGGFPFCLDWCVGAVPGIGGGLCDGASWQTLPLDSRFRFGAVPGIGGGLKPPIRNLVRNSRYAPLLTKPS